MELRRNTHSRAGNHLSRNMLQEEIRSTLSVSTHESTTIILAFRASAIKNEKWTELIDVLLSLQASKRTRIRECED